MQTPTKPANLVEAEEKTALARLAYHLAKSRRAARAALEDLEFWSNKAAMLHVMWERGMLKVAA